MYQMRRGENIGQWSHVVLNLHVGIMLKMSTKIIWLRGLTQ